MSRYYVPEWCRWLNADSINFLNPQNINGMNLFSYCENNPVMNVDPNGNLIFGYKESLRILMNVFDWISDTLGACVKIVDTKEQPLIENFFAGIIQGTQTTKFILGDDSKPVTFFAENASSWWKFWEYKIGVSINIGRFSYTATAGIGSQSFNFGWENKSFEFFKEINKIGIGASYGSGNTTLYTILCQAN